MSIKLIVGLANPGIEYINTRHNVGSWYIKFLANRLCVSLHKNSSFLGYTSYVNFAGVMLHLLIPNIFMNLNGHSIISMVTYYKISSNEILIVHDDMLLPYGTAKFKLGSYNGGHNGLKDITKLLGQDQHFYRLRIGIGYPGVKEKVVKFVLSEPSLFERNLINKTIIEALYCTEIWFQQNFAKAVSRLHSFKAE